MLTMMRNMLRSKAAGGLFVLLIVAMAAWGVTDIFGGGLGNNLLKVGERSLSDQEFDASIERVLRNATDDRGRALTKAQALDQGIIDQVYQREQYQLILTAYADKLGITATTGAIADAIRNDAIFQDSTGVFDQVMYTRLLRDNGYRPEDYQASLEAEMSVERLQGMPITALKVPSALARLQAAFNTESRSAEWFALPQAGLPPIADPTEEDLRTLYETRSDALLEPERRAISVIRLSPEDFRAQVDIPEEDVVAYYEAYKDQRYTGPDTRTFTEFAFADEETARAALGRIAGGARPETIETALTTAIRSGGKDSITNARLSDQVFSVAARTGSIHGPQPVGTEFIVVRLEDIIQGAVTPLESVRDEIYNELERVQAVGLYYDALTLFDDLIGTGAGLEEIAESLGAPVLSFTAVDRNGVSETGTRYTPLASALDLLPRAFNLPEGVNTERLEGDDVTWLGRVDTITLERQPDFEEVSDLLETAWRQQQESDQLANVASEIEAALRDGTSTLEAEAEKYGSAVQALPRPITRTNPNAPLPRPLIENLFAANDEGDVFSSPGLPGEMIVLQVTQIIRPAPETLDVLSESSALDIQDSLADDLFTAYLMGIQNDIEIQSNLAAYNTYKAGIERTE